MTDQVRKWKRTRPEASSSIEGTSKRIKADGESVMVRVARYVQGQDGNLQEKPLGAPFLRDEKVVYGGCNLNPVPIRVLSYMTLNNNNKQTTHNNNKAPFLVLWPFCVAT